VAYSSGGVPLWTNHIDEPEGFANAVIANNGKVFIAGGSWNGIDNDYRTIAYSTAGVPLWTNRYGGLHDYDAVTAMALDPNGNVVITGPSNEGSSLWDYVTIQYSDDGAPLWTNRYDGGIGNREDVASAVAVDGSGNVFVTGSSEGVNYFKDFATVAYSSDGTPLWTARYDGPGNSDDQAFGLALDSQGNVIVSGTSGETVLIKYSNMGEPLWTNRTGSGYYSQLAVDGSDNIFLATAGFTMKYSSTGVPRWTNLYVGGLRSIALDGWGNVFVTGSLYIGTNSWSETVAYSNAGEPLWTNSHSRMGNASGNGLKVDPAGNVFVTGQSWNGTNYDFFTIKYSPTVPLVRLHLEQDGSGGYYIRFTGVPGSTYRLQRAATLTGPWTSSAPQTAPDSGPVEFHDPFPLPGQAFYRTVQP